VLLRTRLDWQAASGGAWTRARDDRRVVPFVIRDGLDDIAVDGQALDEGLVAVPRLSVGRASEVDELASSGVAPDATARYSTERISTVEHAAVLGVPSRAADGRRVIGPGLGRPLILSTLEDDEAMRVLAGGAAGRSRLAVAFLVGGALLIVVAGGWWLIDALFGGGVAAVLAASPEPTLRPGTDTRTTGSSPSFIGEPILAFLGVLGVALISLVASLAWIRLTGGPRRPSR
jgi:hypothetical protein